MKNKIYIDIMKFVIGNVNLNKTYGMVEISYKLFFIRWTVFEVGNKDWIVLLDEK